MAPGLGHWSYLPAALVGLAFFGRKAFALARTGTPFSIEMLMSVAAVGAILIGATAEAAPVVFLFAVGELLEGVAAGRARAGIRALEVLVPRTALLVDGGAARPVPTASLKVGDVVLVRPGDHSLPTARWPRASPSWTGARQFHHPAGVAPGSSNKQSARRGAPAPNRSWPLHAQSRLP